MRRWISFFSIVSILTQTSITAKEYRTDDGKIKIAIVKNPYSGSRSSAELSEGPDALETGGIKNILTKMECLVEKISKAELTDEEKKEYGVWHRLGLANGHLSKIVSSNKKNNLFTVGLLANCNSLMGMLAGLQHSGKGKRPLKIGLVWIDAHGDFNTPETTLSGMLGGMPVAVSAGLCLTRLRIKSGLDPAIPTKHIVMAGVRDTDPLEQELIDRSEIEMISVKDIKDLSPNIHHQMKRLSRLIDLIYIHIDMDVLEPDEVSGHSLTVPNGPTSNELAKALSLMFEYKKTAALGIASYPVKKDNDKKSLNAAFNLIIGAVKGLKNR